MAKADKKILIILNIYFSEKNALEKLVRQTVTDIGYEQENFHWNTLSIKN